jgi:transposase InsO family protein
MTGDSEQFSELKNKNGGFVIFGDKSKGQVKGIGKIGKNSASINSVLFVSGLKYNLLSISQLCNKGLRIIFEATKCIVEKALTKEILFYGKREGNIYVVYLSELDNMDVCLSANKHEDSWLWYRRLGHASIGVISKLATKDLVVGLPKINFSLDYLCDACMKGKQTKISFKPKNVLSTSKPLQLIHIDLFGPTKIASLGGKYFGFVIVDDFSRYTWVLFLASRSDTLTKFVSFCKKVENETGYKIGCIRSDHGTEFQNQNFDEFCNSRGYSHNFSAPRIPQQNSVERKNRVLEEMSRTILNEQNAPKQFWAEAVNTACHIINRAMIRPILKKTPYELLKGRKPNRIYNKRTKTVEESVQKLNLNMTKLCKSKMVS